MVINCEHNFCRYLLSNYGDGDFTYGDGRGSGNVSRISSVSSYAFLGNGFEGNYGNTEGDGFLMLCIANLNDAQLVLLAVTKAEYVLRTLG